MARLAAGAARDAGDGAGGHPGSHRRRIAFLATGIAGPLAVAGAVAATLSGASPARGTALVSATATASPSTPPSTAPSGPLQVLSVTEGGATRNTNGAKPVTVQMSAPLASSSPLPTVRPAVAGRWTRSGATLTFTPAWPLQPGSQLQVRIPGGRSGVRTPGGSHLARTVARTVTTAGWSGLRQQQLLAQLGYLPRYFKAASPATALPSTVPGELASVYTPPAGRFVWLRGYPSILTRFWGGPNSLIIEGAVRAFQAQHGLVMTGHLTSATWMDLLRAAAGKQRNRHGYTYAWASKAQPETLTVWHNGKIILRSLANTGIPASPTADGTYPVYLRYYYQVMRGRNPDGSKYADPVYYVAYFNGGDAVHYFPRASYGWPQSLGCVELPWGPAKQVWPYLSYGTLVTVTG
jgi:peptidoglycan hydrolase-like protein with peptidoglycan-binding domain